MPKTKISEYSVTNSSNTDIEGINIDEGCAPSGINNAIRELMVHLKEFQTGASGDAFTFAGGVLISGTANTITGNVLMSGTNTITGSTTATFAAGAVGTPSIAAHGDTNTGIFFPAADTIAFAEGGAEAMRIDSSGNLGLGTTSPANYANYKTLTIQGPSGGTGAELDWKNPSGTTVGAIYSTATDFVIASDFTNTIASSNLTFTTDGSERMRITSGGDVGIGTSSPGQVFEVSKSANGEYGMIIRNATSNTNAASLLRFYAGTDTAAIIRFPAGHSSKPNELFITNVGTTSPIAFATQDTERARITSGGMLAINATTAVSGNTSAKLVVKGASGADVGEVQVATNGTYAFDFRNASGTNVGNITVNSGGTAFTTTSDYRLKENIQPMQNALATVIQLKPCTYIWKADGSNGQGFIAHELQAVVPDAVTGEKDATQTVQYEVTPAVYEDVVIPAVLDDEGNEVEPERTEKQLVSEAVMGEREVPRYQGVDTSFLVATLTAAIQELAAKNDALEARLAALEAK